MGSLAAEKPEHGKPLSGILIKRGFNYHLIAPDDLQSKSANLSNTELSSLVRRKNQPLPLWVKLSMVIPKPHTNYDMEPSSICRHLTYV